MLFIRGLVLSLFLAPAWGVQWYVVLRGSRQQMPQLYMLQACSAASGLAGCSSQLGVEFGAAPFVELWCASIVFAGVCWCLWQAPPPHAWPQVAAELGTSALHHLVSVSFIVRRFMEVLWKRAASKWRMRT